MKTKLIVIGGIPGTGKTTIAYKLALKLKIDKVISTDIIKMNLRSIIDKEKSPYIFATTYESYLLENLTLINGFLKHSRIINNYIINMLNGISDSVVIIEGATINNEFISKLDKEKYDVLYINLTIDKKELIKRYKNKEKIRKSNWLKNIDNILIINNYLIENSIINIDSYNLNKSVNKVVKLINENLCM